MSSVTVPLYHYGILKGYLYGQNPPSEVLTAVEALYMAAIQGPLREDALEAIQAVREAAEKLTGMAVAPARLERPVTKPELPMNLPDTDEPELPPLTKRALEIASKHSNPPESASKPQTDESKIAAFLNERSAEQCPSGHALADKNGVVVGSSEPKKRKEWSPEARAAAGERMRARQAAGLMKGRKRAAPEAFEIDPSEPVLPSFAESELRITVPLKRRNTRLTDDDWPDIKSRIAIGDSRKAIAGDYDEDLEDLEFFIQSCERREAGQSLGEA